MSQALLIDHAQPCLKRNAIEDDTENALKFIIAEQSNGVSCEEYLHRIIRAVMSKNDNNLKRLMYYYLEAIRDDKGLMVCINQISKDLHSPNEYIRGLVLRFISRLNNSEYLSYLLKDIVDNLSNKNAYVRLNAVACLSEISARFEIDVEAELVEALRRESNPEVLQVFFNSMDRLGIPTDENCRNAISETSLYTEDVLLALIKNTENKEFLGLMQSSEYASLVFWSGYKILVLAATSKFTDESIIKQSMENIINIVQHNPKCRIDFRLVLPYIRGNAIPLLELIREYELGLSKQLLDSAFLNVETHEFVKFGEVLSEKYKECSGETDRSIKYKVLLLEGLTRLAKEYCVIISSLFDSCLNGFLTAEPAVGYASLNYLKACLFKPDKKDEVLACLINSLSRVEHGKHFRLVLDIVAEADSVDLFDSILNKILEDIKKPPKYLLGKNGIFLGTHVALAITSMYKAEWNSDSKIKSKALGVLIRLMQFAEKRQILDSSSRSTFTLCIRRIISGLEKSESVPETGGAIFTLNENIVPVTQPVVIDLLAPLRQIPRFNSEDASEMNENVIQMSGLGDPLYVEATVKHNKYEIIVDLLVINQTASYLQDIAFDFVFPSSLAVCTEFGTFSLQEGSATILQAIFSVKESVSCFISASASFKYPKENEYKLRHLQNLNEIKININEFLEGTSVDFKTEWIKLEWENAYSLSVANAVLAETLDKIVYLCRGYLCSKLVSDEFLIGNIACRTMRGQILLVNLSMSLDSATRIEVRVRGSSENAVTSLSSLLTEYLKGLKQRIN